VLRDLRVAGVVTRRTDQHGTIVFESSGRDLALVE
jgi:hypothetical protein